MGSSKLGAMQPVNDLSAHITRYRPRLTQAIEQVLNSGWVVLGPAVEQFEQDFANYLAAAHCVSVANGTDAIELGLRAVGISAGMTVATVANAAMYATTAILAIGAKPFFMDVALDTRCVGLQSVQDAVEAGAQAVVVTHLYGLAAPEIAEIAAFCASRRIPLLEDCAQAHGARVANQCVGTFGNLSSFSFYPTKNLGALGDGGAVVTQDPDLAGTVRRLRQYGWQAKYEVVLAGARNSRLDALQAAVLSAMLPDLDANNARRRAIAAQYQQGIQHAAVEVPTAAGENYVAHLYVVRSKQRDGLREHLRQRGIATEVHYPIPDYRQALFRELFPHLGLVNTETLCTEVLTLPCYPELQDTAVDAVIQAINDWRP